MLPVSMVSPPRDLCTYKITIGSVYRGFGRPVEAGGSGRSLMVGRGRRVMGIGDGSNGSLGAGSGSFLKPPGLRRGGEGWRGSYPLPPVIGHAAADREPVRIHAESGRNPNIDATRSFDLSYRRAACTQSPRQCNENVKNPCREHGGGAHKRVAFVAAAGVSQKCLPAKPEVAANALMTRARSLRGSRRFLRAFHVCATRMI